MALVPSPPHEKSERFGRNKGRSQPSSIPRPLRSRRDRVKLLPTHPPWRPTQGRPLRKGTPRSSLCTRTELEYEYKTVNILKGEQFSPEFEKLNPLHFVPVLVDEGIVVADSFAIILYLEEKYPQHPLLPHDLQKKAINYQVANIVSSSIQPLQNLPVLNYIEEKFNADKKLEWVQYHVGRGFAALEKLLESHAGKYATGDEVLLADVFLAAQIYAGAVWFKIDMTHYPILARLMDAYDEIPAFRAARPDMQPDYPSTS